MGDQSADPTKTLSSQRNDVGVMHLPPTPHTKTNMMSVVFNRAREK
jgi:hypothetical protein